MVDFETAAFFVLWLLLLGFLATVLLFMLNGRINAKGMLDNKQTGRFSLERMQLLIITLGFAGWYFLEMASQPNALPEVPEAMLWVFGGSQAGYLGPKAWGFIKDIANQGEQNG